MSALELSLKTTEDLNKVQILEKELNTKHTHYNSRNRWRWRSGGGGEKEEEKHQFVTTTSEDKIQDFEGRKGRCGPDPQADSEQLSSSVTVEEDEQVGKVKEEEEEKEGFGDSEEDSSSSSSDIRVRESQNKLFRSEELPLPEQRRRPFSVDFSIHGMDDISFSSLTTCIAGGSVKRSFAMPACRKPGTFPSPGAPNYRHNHGSVVAHPKGWSSERVPSAVNPGKKYISNSLFVPFGSGKGLPSKWEDAEKWILSPVSGDVVGFRNPTLPEHRRRPKSKSGPLGSSPEENGSYVTASPFIQTSTANSPLTTGVLVADDHGRCSNGGSIGGVLACDDTKGSRSCSAAHSGHSILKAASMNGWSDLLDSPPSSNSSQEDFPVSPLVSRKDVATQMSPEWSSHPSPLQKTNSYVNSPSTSNNVSEQSLEYQIRDVQIDERITITRWSKKDSSKGFNKDSTNILKWKKKIIDSRTSEWKTTGNVQYTTKSEREEAKIMAWENLQKAKAESDIRKLEMKLEKKRSSSMNKIFKRLKTAQIKAQEMREILAIVDKGQYPMGVVTDTKAGDHRNSRTSSLTGCFTCHGF